MNYLPSPNKSEKELNIYIPDNTEVDTPKFPDIEYKAEVKKVLNTAENLEALLKYSGLSICFNQMSFEPELFVIDNKSGNLKLVTSSFDSSRSKLISLSSKLGLPKIAIEDHLNALAEKNKYHPVKSWLGDEKWDGKERVKSVLSCLNAKNKDISEIAIKRWLVGCIASIYEEEFRSKLVPVLQGGQSYMKTSFIARLASILPHSFLEGAELNPDNKDSILTAIRSFIVELGELERTSKNSQGSIKAFITKPTDSLRPPYARGDIKKPRQTHFIASVNGSDFLKDETGNSRYVVIEMEKAASIDMLNTILGWHYSSNGSLKLLKPELLKQFWLEVKSLYKSDYGWNLSEQELKVASSINDDFTDKGNLYEYIYGHYLSIDDDKYDKNMKWLTAGELIHYDINLQANQAGNVGKALKKLAKEGKIKMKTERSNSTKYYLPIIPRINKVNDFS